MDYVLAVVLIAALIGGIIFLQKKMAAKRQAEMWSGTVEKKWESAMRDSEGDQVGTNYNIQVALADGKKKKLDVAKSLYDSLEVGNKVDKQAGAMDPVKVG